MTYNLCPSVPKIDFIEVASNEKVFHNIFLITYVFWRQQRSTVQISGAKTLSKFTTRKRTYVTYKSDQLVYDL